jgi:hypothetical protein
MRIFRIKFIHNHNLLIYNNNKVRNNFNLKNLKIGLKILNPVKDLVPSL